MLSHSVKLCSWVVLLAGTMASAAVTLDVELDFYTPMGQSVADDRPYLMTSNGYKPIPAYGNQVMETLCYLKFDLINLPETPVSEARLTLEKTHGYAAMGGGLTSPVIFSVNKVLADVAGLKDGTYTVPEFQDQVNGFIGNAIDAQEVFADGLYTWDITLLVNEWIGGSPNYGLVITGRCDPASQGSQHVEFFSQDGQVSGFGMAPAIALVPEPTVLGLLTGGVLILFKRKNNAC